MGKRSKPYKIGKYIFQYDFDECIVYYVFKVTKEELKENEEWMKMYNRPLYEVNEDGYSDIDGVGLRLSNWKNKEARDYYLNYWIDELEEEARILSKEYEMWG